MAQTYAEQAGEGRAATYKDALLRAPRSRFAASLLFRSQQKERDRMKVAARRHRETKDQRLRGAVVAIQAENKWFPLPELRLYCIQQQGSSPKAMTLSYELSYGPP
ncbi:hypothetical protein NPIL_172171 [Nephila pilipes]|uniref:Uncharacterized protein n=1 Tax=Nephila pilipes TaxID=299642 RepID=A0A8X6T4B9_NEPPI|nr:hypothetical protein NPIL_172171 [Nephila pilipes]